jgi:hypothetical protein
MEKASWGRHRGGGITEEASQRREASWRRHPGGIWETSGRHLWEASGKHLGCSWEASGKLQEASGRRLGALGRSGVSWGGLGS